MSRRTLTAERRLAAHLSDAVGYPVYREDVVDALAAAGLAVVPADMTASNDGPEVSNNDITDAAGGGNDEH